MILHSQQTHLLYAMKQVNTAGKEQNWRREREREREGKRERERERDSKKNECETEYGWKRVVASVKTLNVGQVYRGLEKE